MYPVYIRGEAYLASHRAADAVREFQKILDHPGITTTDPIGALARLQLGRAYALSMDQGRAKLSYEKFLDLWNGADADLPILKKAKLEYVRFP